MFDAMAEWMTVPLLQHEGGKPPQRMGLAGRISVNAALLADPSKLVV